MIEIRIASSDLHTLRNSVLRDNQERCAVLFAGLGHCSDGRVLMLVRESEYPQDKDYTRHGLDHAELSSEFVARVAKKARLNDLSLVFVHSHPGNSIPQFSRVDDAGEEKLALFLTRRGQTVPHGALVISEGGVSARVLGKNKFIRVVSVGNERIVEASPEAKSTETFPMFNRQVKAFGEIGQRILRNLRVAIVGVGGTGSIAVQQLVHLGISRFILIDPDSLELTNLNRVVGAFQADVGYSKVGVAQRYIRQISPTADVQMVKGDIVYASVARELVDADIIYCCTDSHGSRSVIQQVAYQYLIPCIDVGSIITTSEKTVTGIFGRVQLIGPDQPCLWCSNLLNSDEIRRDMMNEFKKRSDPYIQGIRVTAPSVVSLNGTVVSLAISMLLGLVTSIPFKSRHLIYDAMSPRLQSVTTCAKGDCYICSRSGVYGYGDARELFARRV